MLRCHVRNRALPDGRVANPDCALRLPVIAPSLREDVHRPPPVFHCVHADSFPDHIWSNFLSAPPSSCTPPLFQRSGKVVLEYPRNERPGARMCGDCARTSRVFLQTGAHSSHIPAGLSRACWNIGGVRGSGKDIGGVRRHHARIPEECAGCLQGYRRSARLRQGYRRSAPVTFKHRRLPRLPY